MRLGGAMLFVRDLERMAAFYTDVIGLRPVEQTKMDDWIEFNADGARFSLHAIPQQLLDTRYTSAPAPPRENQPCKLIFSAADLDAEQTRLIEAGVRILRRPWGGWDAVDPEGNVLGFRQAT